MIVTAGLVDQRPEVPTHDEACRYDGTELM
jgi:hypothetical protein